MTNLTNYFLVSMPTIMDPVFSGSLVYLTSHDVGTGAVGVIVNKPLNRTLKNAFKDLDLDKYNPQWSSNPLYLGGPLASENGFVLHRSNQLDKQMFELTNNRSILSDIASSEYKDRLFISVGYAAWDNAQIEDEIKHSDWLVVKADIGIIYDVDASMRYHEALRLLGINTPAALYCGGEVIA